MKTKYLFFAILSLITASMMSCTRMNDLHDEYLKDGPIVYVGRIDSLRAYAGYNRVKVLYYVTDPRAKEVCFYWNSRRDSSKFDIPAHSAAEMLEVEINPIMEGDLAVEAFTYDKKGHRSIKFETPMKIYGDKYVASLVPRGVRSASVADNVLTVSWGGKSSQTEVGINVYYTDVNGAAKVAELSVPDDGGNTTIADVDPSCPITYMTCYMPYSTALDVFQSMEKTIVIE